MSMKMSVDAYKELIAGNIAWLREQPDSCECSHIMGIVLDSVNYYYPENYKENLELLEIKLSGYKELSELMEIRWKEGFNKIESLNKVVKFMFDNGGFYPEAVDYIDKQLAQLEDNNV